MALVTVRCSSKGALIIFTIDDVSLRATQIQWITATRQATIRVFNDQGVLVLEINTGQTASPQVIDLPAVLREITKPDLSVKSYLTLSWSVNF